MHAINFVEVNATKKILECSIFASFFAAYLQFYLDNGFFLQM